MEEDYKQFLKDKPNKKYKIILSLNPEEYLEFDIEDFETYRKMRKREWIGLAATRCKDSVCEEVKF